MCFFFECFCSKAIDYDDEHHHRHPLYEYEEEDAKKFFVFFILVSEKEKLWFCWKVYFVLLETRDTSHFW